MEDWQNLTSGLYVYLTEEEETFKLNNTVRKQHFHTQTNTLKIA